MSDSLKICFVASELAPFAKTGGLADVAAALPTELARKGHDVRLIVPLHGTIDTAPLDLRPVDSIIDVPIEIGWKTYSFSARTATIGTAGVQVRFVDCPELFDRESIYTGNDDEAVRFAMFSRAAIECCQREVWAPDVIHCNDWHTSLTPLLLRTIYEWDALFAKTRTLLTIHNIGYQGVFPRESIDELGLGQWTHLFDQGELEAGRVSFLRTGLIYADTISTVSPTYAREIQTEAYGMGLERLLGARDDALVGILNGVDYGVWNPEHDPLIAHPYSADDLGGKKKNKTHLLNSLGLEGDGRAPLAGIVSRLVHQKGFDLCFEVLPEALATRDVRLVVLGSGEPRYEEFFTELQASFPGRICYHRGYHDELAHMIEAASDMFLMPSRYEPCGLNQMFGMKYGTIPIVRKTGGLADSVRPFDPTTGEGTGFVFDHATPDGLRWALNHALDCYDDRSLWDRLVANAMQENFSWEAQVEPYERLYARMLQR